MNIHVLKNGLRYGPYSVEELRQQLNDGWFRPENFASVDNSHTWTPINRLPAFSHQTFSVKTDKRRNLLVINYRGRVTRDDVEQCREEVRGVLGKLDRDFQLLADFTDVEVMDISCASVVAEIMDICNQAGVANVVRVIPESRQDIGLQIMSLFHYSGDVGIATCASRDEAAKILDRQQNNPAGKPTAAAASQ